MKTADSVTSHDCPISPIKSLTQLCTIRHASVGPGLVAFDTREVCISSSSSPTTRYRLDGTAELISDMWVKYDAPVCGLTYGLRILSSMYPAIVRLGAVVDILSRCRSPCSMPPSSILEAFA